MANLPEPHPSPDQRDGRQAIARLLDNPRLLRPLSFAVVLVLLIALVRLPLQFSGATDNWINVWGDDTIQLHPDRPEVPDIPADGGVVTQFTRDVLPVEEVDLTTNQGEETEAIEEEFQSRALDIDKLFQQPALEFAEVQPEIAGGLKNLYLRINYPKDALDQGIQGLTVLLFVVEPDGTPSGITVEKPLYPSCDSAAVAAVRETLFVPGQQNGEIVRVKMRLPVRFKLVDRDPLSDSTATSLR